MSLLGQLFRLLGEHITIEDLSTIWYHASNQVGVAVINILNLMADLAASKFTQTQLKHLLCLIETVSIN